MILSMPTLRKKATRLCDYFPTISRPPADYFSTILRLSPDYLIFWYVVESVWSGGGSGMVGFWYSWLGFQVSKFPQLLQLLQVFPIWLLSYDYSINAFKTKIRAFFNVLMLTLYIYITLIKTFKKCLKIAL